MATFTPDTSNTLFQLAADLINQSCRNIFLTGKAGTGKTTFLKYIRENCPKQMAVVAPTGVAAINAGGVTIHSFFQLPFSPFIPAPKGFSRNDITVNRHNLISRLRFSNEKRKVLQQLELLIIDEISMVRCDLLDALDTVLRHFRRRPYERFGGVQVLFIGDMYQLPPVVKNEEWNLLSEYYDSPYFFDSHVIKEEQPLYIEFNKIYRQSEERFISVLNQVRNNELDKDGLSILESRYRPVFKRTNNDGYIVLTTHNEQARNINTAELQRLTTSVHSYQAEIENDFPVSSYPADETLYLKEGAQVMFIRNDTADRGKRYFNGKIGIITRLEEDKIFVTCTDEDFEIGVDKEQWENIRYTLDKASQTMKEEVLGTFSQFPLRLAWAITIHKSQGLTFEKAIIDAGEAFAPGQVYVALSRCTSLDGMVLKSRLRINSMLTDQRIVLFSQKISSSQTLQEELQEARKQYQQKILLSSFDFRIVVNHADELKEYLLQNNSSFNAETFSWIEELQAKLTAMQETAVKFHGWIEGQFLQPVLPEENAVLTERTAKASLHFVREIDEAVSLLHQSPAITDSKHHAKEFNDAAKNIFAELSAAKHLLTGFSGKVDAEAWHQQRRSFVLPVFSINAYAGASHRKIDNPNPVLHQQLRKLRDAICEKKNLPLYLVLGSSTLDEMARYLPQSLVDLRRIGGFGDKKIEQYGQQFLDVVLGYCKEHNLESHIEEKTPKRERKKKEKSEVKKKKGDSHAESFRLHKEGKTVSEIAKERNLAVSTIEGHLAKFVADGSIDICDLVSKEKYGLIEAALKDFDGTSANPVKSKLGNDVSYGEIKMVMAALGIKQQHSTD